MKLDDFIKEPAFKKYEKEINEYRKEFIASGCEKFLWPRFSDKKAAMEYTCSLAEQRKNLRLHPNVTNFLKRIEQLCNEDVVFIYPEDYSPKFLMCQEISKSAVQSFIVDNIFAEDDTINWISVFNKSNLDAIGMMFSIIYSNVSYSGDNFGGYKLFGKGLMYYSECLQHKGHVLEPEWPNTLAHFQGNAFRRDTNPKIILESRKVVSMLVRLGYFKDEYEIFYNLYHGLLPFLHKIYENTEQLIHGKERIWRNEVKKLESRLVAEGVIVSKWKSEQTLFTLVRKSFPDALFQYRPHWLEPQNLDIYIPSQNIGIEYQGIQHYKSIEFFGGDTAFEHRKQLDERKRKLCSENGVKLIAWPYTDEISQKALKKKLSEV